MTAEQGAQLLQPADQGARSADAAGHEVAMPAGVFRERRDAEIGAMLQRRLQEGAEEGVVDGDDRPLALRERDAVGEAADHGEVGDGAGGIGRALDHDERERPACHGGIRDGGHMRLIHAIGEAEDVHAHLGHVRMQQHVRAAIDRAAVHHGIAGTEQAHGNGRDRRHATGEKRAVLGAVERRDAGLRHDEVRMVEAGIDIAVLPAALGDRAVEEGLMHRLRPVPPRHRRRSRSCRSAAWRRSHAPPGRSPH